MMQGGMIQPIEGRGVMFCSERCPQYEGGKCRLTDKAVFLEALCEPWVRETIAMMPNPASGLVVSFIGPGGADHTLSPVGQVTVTQLMALGQALITRADLAMKMELQIEAEKLREGRSKIIAPGMPPDELRQVLAGIRGD